MIRKTGVRALSAMALSVGVWHASAFHVTEHLYKPAGQCLIAAGRIMTNLESHLSDAATANSSITYASQNLSGPLASIQVSLQTIGAAQVWHITGALREKGCGILSDAALSCYLVDPCANAIGPNTSYSCNQSWWNGLDSGLNQISCHLTLKPSNVDMFSDHDRVCAGLTPYLAQDRSFFDVVSADGNSECDLF